MYGRELLITPSYQGTDYNNITYPIEWIEKTDLVSLPPEIFELGADAYQASIDQHPPSGAKLAQTYLKMADWYWRAKNKAKAIEATQKAVEAMKSEKLPDSVLGK